MAKKVKDHMLVSIWLGNFPTAEELEKYVEVGPRSKRSTFMKDYKIRNIDPDFMESGWETYTESIEELLKKNSYSEFYIDMVKEKNPDLKASDYNSTILIIDEYTGNITQTADTIFIGSYFFEYEMVRYW